MNSRLVKALSLYAGSIVSCMVAGTAVWVVEKTVVEKKRAELEALLAKKDASPSAVQQPAASVPVAVPATPAMTEPTAFVGPPEFTGPTEPQDTKDPEEPVAEAPDWLTFNVARKSRPKTRLDE